LYVMVKVYSFSSFPTRTLNVRLALVGTIVIEMLNLDDPCVERA
jgi:hypothetical protein